MNPVMIAGGGLAGLTAGIFLRRKGVPVRIMESAGYPRHRVCGEFICPRSPDFLAHMGLEPVFREAREARRVCWVGPSGGRIFFDLPWPARTLSRYRLDERLAGMFMDLGGDLATGARAAFPPAEGVVWAAGRASGPPQWIGLKAHYRGLPLESDLEMHVGRGAYVGLCRVEEDRVNVCGLFRAERIGGGRKELLERTMEKFGLSRLADRLGRSQADPESVCSVSGLVLGEEKNDGGLRLGDSWSVIPPFTGNGMTMALEAAWRAAPFLVKYARGESGWEDACRAVRGDLRRHFRYRLRWANVLHGALLGAWGQRLLSNEKLSSWIPWQTFVRLSG
jgi:flavin-dependent dehydrogenase